jgi:2-amino-4-hydroxy-6-hydroxymethyldihydropteridine diphosphokinase
MPIRSNVLLAFGANLGNREQTLHRAWLEMMQLPKTLTVQLSRFYETQPVGGPLEQPDYINAAGTVQTELSPQELLAQLQKIENHFGRVRTEHWGPRTLDIDILLYGTEVIHTQELKIPHPEMLHRTFVLLPSQDVASDWIHPANGFTLAELWKRSNQESAFER